MGAASPMPNLPPLTGLEPERWAQRMEFRSCKGNRLCLRRGMLNLTGNKAGKVFRCDSNLENLYQSKSLALFNFRERISGWKFVD